jgi:UDP-N-acetylmuramoyl-L-alanyl-D-glutamate--2,6-diaminopimelate ligase
MGRIAAELADELVITDDNPRREDPRRIVEQIVSGVGSGVTMQVEHDRKQAIRLAIRASTAGDVILVAGKGHEDYQIYGTERRAFSDREAVLEVLEEAGT